MLSKRAFRLFPLFVILAIVGASFTIPAFAATLNTPAPSILVTCTSAISSVSTTLNYDRNTSGTGQETVLFEARDGAGTVLYLETATQIVPSTGPINVVTIPLTTTPAYNPLTFRVYSPAGNGFPEQVVYTSTSTCAGLPTLGFQGPGVPGGFVLKTITCDVAVFDAPGGQPVGSNAIKGGQTWYVNPTPVKDAAGKSWTEIFVAGFTNGYVPTSCVH